MTDLKHDDFETHITTMLHRVARHAPSSVQPPVERSSATDRLPHTAIRHMIVAIGALAVLGALAVGAIAQSQRRGDDAAPVASSGATVSAAAASSPLVDALLALGSKVELAPPGWLELASATTFCGVAGMDESTAARQCFLDASLSHSGATVVVAQGTAEGDLVLSVHTVLADGGFASLYDATQDSFDSRTWERLVCSGIAGGEIDVGGEEPQSPHFFKVHGCGDAPLPPVAAIGPPVPNWFASRDVAASCGTVFGFPDPSDPGVGRLSADARACVLAALSVGDDFEIGYRLPPEGDLVRARWYRWVGHHEVVEFNGGWARYRCRKAAVDDEGQVFRGALANLGCTVSGPACPAAEQLAEYLRVGRTAFEYTPSEAPRDIAEGMDLWIGTLSGVEHSEAELRSTLMFGELTQAPKRGLIGPPVVQLFQLRGDEVAPPVAAQIHVLAITSPLGERSVVPEGLWLACELDEPAVPVYEVPIGPGWIGVSTLNEIHAALED